MYGIFSYVRKRADTAPTKLAGVPIVMCGPKKRKLVLRATSPGSKHLPQHGCNAAWLSVKRSRLLGFTWAEDLRRSERRPVKKGHHTEKLQMQTAGSPGLRHSSDRAEGGKVRIMGGGEFNIGTRWVRGASMRRKPVKTRGNRPIEGLK